MQAEIFNEIQIIIWRYPVKSPGNRRKTALLHLTYDAHQQEALTRVLADFSEKAASRGIDCRLADFYDIPEK